MHRDLRLAAPFLDARAKQYGDRRGKQDDIFQQELSRHG